MPPQDWQDMAFERDKERERVFLFLLLPLAFCRTLRRRKKKKKMTSCCTEKTRERSKKMTAAAHAPTSAPRSCPDALPILPPGSTPAGGRKEQLQLSALPALKLIQIPGEDDPSAFFEHFDGLTFSCRWLKTKRKELTFISFSLSAPLQTTKTSPGAAPGSGRRRRDPQDGTAGRGQGGEQREASGEKLPSRKREKTQFLFPTSSSSSPPQKKFSFS